MAMTDCRYFNGYKPCGKSTVCDASCAQTRTATHRILLVHLEALGAVLRSTALLPAIRRKFPGAHLTWVTSASAAPLLSNNSFIDRVLTTTIDDLLELSALEFDVAFVVDKSLKASGVIKQTTVDQVYGFISDSRSGAIHPATPGAQELWEIGLSDQRKFFENQKAETQLIHEALELGPWVRDPYSVEFTGVELREAQSRRDSWLRKGETAIVGLNTGCSGVLQHKKLSVQTHRELVSRLVDLNCRVVLLGGREDQIRNEQIAAGLNVVQTPTNSGLRDGLISVNACDAIVTGDSLGLHMAIALKKWSVAWFGPSCAQEIDLYERGVKVLTKAPCSPCWKRTCDRNPMCYDQVSVDELIDAVTRGLTFNDRLELRERADRRSPQP